MKTKKFTGDRIFDFVNVTVILLITIIILFPQDIILEFPHF